MDEGECETRRNALLQHVQDLESQFGLLREQLYRERMSQNIVNQYEAEEQAALQNFESEKNLACDYYYSELMETIRRLEEDRHNSEISWGEGGEWGSRSRSRSRRKAVTVSGPYIVYMLKPQDILEDWTIIRKALKKDALTFGL
ncbi:hypothetical protein NQ314_002988 [Rhamnusium bicolor]|uniref:Breast cancer metastasis-suppressor 1-like protein n=1 Tax=Rhamnusium bicolor TaxID=1586634 RepID=A0AAV8ZNB8_9CUCU|nr:hypothetical protein NQ314_002988 [Rhamnusium bicolor]